jgi:pimeloyl-ACP methyl ester carboxylesterase
LESEIRCASYLPAQETYDRIAERKIMIRTMLVSAMMLLDRYKAFIGDISKMWGTEMPDSFDRLAKVTLPTLVLQSEHDENVLEAHAQKIAKTIPNAKYQVLKSVSHFAVFQAPGEYTSAIRDFIK